MKIGRNDPCHCGSGNKYKKCCSEKDDLARTAEFAAQEAARAAALSAEAEDVEGTPQDANKSIPRAAAAAPGRKAPAAHGPPPLHRRRAV